MRHGFIWRNNYLNNEGDMIMATTEQIKTNYEWFLETIDTFKNSQGFYSRIARALNEMSEEDKEELKEEYNNLEQKFNSVLDVVLFLEQ